MPGPKPKLHLPVSRWPQADIAIWQTAADEDDLFGEAPGTRLAETTLKSRHMAWRRWLGFLTLYEPAALAIAPLERITPERLRRFTRHLAETNIAYSVACQFDAFYSAARTVFPQTDWSWLRKIKARLFAIAPNAARKGPVISSLQLVELGFELMGEADLASAQNISMADAIKYRDGLIIALLGYVPVRHKNMAGLEIGRDFLNEGSSW